MASQLPNFTLELHGDMKANWEYFCETFESYVTLMGYRPKYTAKEMAALKYALPKEARAVLKNSIKWEQGEDQQDPALTLKKLGKYYAGTKNHLLKVNEPLWEINKSEMLCHIVHITSDNRGVSSSAQGELPVLLFRTSWVIGGPSSSLLLISFRGFWFPARSRCIELPSRILLL